VKRKQRKTKGETGEIATDAYHTRLRGLQYSVGRAALDHYTTIELLRPPVRVAHSVKRGRATLSPLE
jgi:hypothetical protein